MAACVVVCVAAVLCASSTFAADGPPIFSTKSVPTLIADAKAAKDKKDADKILVIKATAVWCGPCKQMDKTTWIDENVVAWFKEHGTAAQFDVDKENSLALQFNISAMPTMIALKNGEEFDRIVGYRSAAQLIAWLDGVRAGKKAADKMEEKAKNAKGGGVDLKTRYRNATDLARAGKKQEALDEYLWLWENMTKVEPSMIGVRGSFFASEMKALASSHPPAKEAFAKQRDDLEEALKTDKSDLRVRDDWVVLNEVVGDDDRTLAWFDKAKKDPVEKQSLERVSHRVQRLLVERTRLADLAILIDDPASVVRQSLDIMGMSKERAAAGMNEGQRRQIRESMVRASGTQISPIYAAMLVADRNEDATKVLDLVSAEDDSGELRVMLVNAALDAGKANEAMKAALDGAKEKGASADAARQKLEAALAAQKK